LLACAGAAATLAWAEVLFIVVISACIKARRGL
jgi:hypothetical protein